MTQTTCASTASPNSLWHVLIRDYSMQRFCREDALSVTKACQLLDRPCRVDHLRWRECKGFETTWLVHPTPGERDKNPGAKDLSGAAGLLLIIPCRAQIAQCVQHTPLLRFSLHNLWSNRSLSPAWINRGALNYFLTLNQSIL